MRESSTQDCARPSHPAAIVGVDELAVQINGKTKKQNKKQPLKAAGPFRPWGALKGAWARALEGLVSSVVVSEKQTPPHASIILVARALLRYRAVMFGVDSTNRLLESMC